MEQPLNVLRAAGYAPVAETADGVAVLEHAEPRRAPTKNTTARTAKVVGISDARPSRTSVPAPRRAPVPSAPAEPTLIAKKLLATPDFVLAAPGPTFRTISSHARNLTAAGARILAHAVDSRRRAVPEGMAQSDRGRACSQRVC